MHPSVPLLSPGLRAAAGWWFSEHSSSTRKLMSMNAVLNENSFVLGVVLVATAGNARAKGIKLYIT